VLNVLRVNISRKIKEIKRERERLRERERERGEERRGEK